MYIFQVGGGDGHVQISGFPTYDRYGNVHQISIIDPPPNNVQRWGGGEIVGVGDIGLRAAFLHGFSMCMGGWVAHRHFGDLGLPAEVASANVHPSSAGFPEKPGRLL